MGRAEGRQTPKYLPPLANVDIEKQTVSMTPNNRNVAMREKLESSLLNDSMANDILTQRLLNQSNSDAWKLKKKQAPPSRRPTSLLLVPHLTQNRNQISLPPASLAAIQTESSVNLACTHIYAVARPASIAAPR